MTVHEPRTSPTKTECRLALRPWYHPLTAARIRVYVDTWKSDYLMSR